MRHSPISHLSNEDEPGRQTEGGKDMQMCSWSLSQSSNQVLNKLSSSFSVPATLINTTNPTPFRKSILIFCSGSFILLSVARLPNRFCNCTTCNGMLCRHIFVIYVHGMIRMCCNDYISKIKLIYMFRDLGLLKEMSSLISEIPRCEWIGVTL